MRKHFVGCVLLACTIAGGLVACGSDDGAGRGDADLGRATLRIVQVPPQTHCIVVGAVGISRSAEQHFDVLPGEESILNLEALPTGEVTFEGSAYAEVCGDVTDAAVATWVAAPVVATLIPAVPTGLTLTFVQNGIAEVTADFDDEGGGGGGCAGDLVECNGTCVDLMTDPQHCGACASPCAPSAACEAGVCVQQDQFSVSFEQGQAPTPEQCSDWNEYRSGLGFGYSAITLEGSLAGGPVVCNDPARASMLCDALRNGHDLQLICGGQSWVVGHCQGGVGVVVGGGGNPCSCGAQAALRPCVFDERWGGVQTPVCGAPSQTITFRCE